MILIIGWYLRRMIPNTLSSHFASLTFFCCGSFFLAFSACNPSPKSAHELLFIPEIDGEAISFLGDTLLSPEIDVDEFLRMDSLLEEANRSFEDDSTNLQAIIWYGRRLAYLHRYKDAIKVFSDGIEHHPLSPELYRHRGHRYITIRQPDLAIADLMRASVLAEQREMEIEPDGIPNKLDIPLSNLHFNIYYHLGLAWYLKGDFQKAIAAFTTCQSYSNNPDLSVATLHWLYLSYLKSGEKHKADALLDPVSPDMEIIENGDYLLSLLAFKQQDSLSSNWQSSSNQEVNAAHLYGFTCWLDAHHEPAKASALRSDILSDERWFTFGYIAAEADSARILEQ